MSGTERLMPHGVDPAGSLSTVFQLGLIKVKPMEERLIVKSGGLKFIERRRMLKSEIDSTNDFKSVFTEMVLSEAGVPDRFRISDVAKRWTERLNSILDKDPALKDAMEKADKAKERDYVGAFRKGVYCKGTR